MSTIQQTGETTPSSALNTISAISSSHRLLHLNQPMLVLLQTSARSVHHSETMSLKTVNLLQAQSIFLKSTGTIILALPVKKKNLNRQSLTILPQRMNSIPFALNSTPTSPISLHWSVQTLTHATLTTIKPEDSPETNSAPVETRLTQNFPQFSPLSKEPLLREVQEQGTPPTADSAAAHSVGEEI